MTLKKPNLSLPLPKLLPARTLSLADIRSLAYSVSWYFQYNAYQISLVKRGSVYSAHTSIYDITIHGKTEKSVYARSTSPRFWRRAIERIADEERLNHEAKHAKVGGRRKSGISSSPLYCSETTLHRTNQKRERNKSTLSKYEVLDSKTQKRINLWDLCQISEKNRINQTYSMIKNTEALGKKKGFDWLFITLTAPPKYHPNPSSGKRSYDPSLGIKSSHTYISEAWKKIRATLNSKNIKASPEQYFGIRTVEPHKDGCIHWHLIIFAHPDCIDPLCEVVERYFTLKNQAEIVRGDYSKGSAASYLYKYIVKGLATESIKMNPSETLVDEQREENDLASMRQSERVQAALRTLRIRQYQTIGLLRVTTLLKEINKLDLESETTEKGSTLEFVKENVWRNKEGLLNMLENPNLFSNDQDSPPSIRLLKAKTQNRYGEAVDKITGVIIDGQKYSRAARYRLLPA